MTLPDPLSLRVLHHLQDLRTPALDHFALSVSGGGRGIWVLLAATLFFWFFGPRRGWRLAFALILADLCCDGLKNLLQVPRPWLADPSILPDPAALATAPGFSFPSGHVVNASALAFALAAEAPSRARPAAWTLAILWTALMAFVRMALGVHTPADVLAAALLSALAVWTTHRLFAYADRRPAVRPALLTCALLLAALVAAAVAFCPRPPDALRFGEDAFRAAACLAGMVLALPLERRFVRHDPARYSPLWLAIGAILILFSLNLAVTALPAALTALFALPPFYSAILTAFLNPLLAFLLLPLLFTPLRRTP